MAKKSKTQRAKASAARQQRKAARAQEDLAPKDEVELVEEEPEKKGLFKKSSSDGSGAQASESDKKVEAKKSEAKAKAPKKRGRVRQFFHDVRSEMHRVTWPSRVDVLRWSGVVVVALLFFGIFVALLDNVIVTPLLFLVSGLGA